MIFLCYPKCSTCQKAQKWLDENQIRYTLRDIKEDKPTLAELTQWYKHSGLPLKSFFNTSGLLYRSLDLKNKLPTMTEEEMLRLLSTDGIYRGTRSGCLQRSTRFRTSLGRRN